MVRTTPRLRVRKERDLRAFSDDFRPRIDVGDAEKIARDMDFEVPDASVMDRSNHYGREVVSAGDLEVTLSLDENILVIRSHAVNITNRSADRAGNRRSFYFSDK